MGVIVVWGDSMCVHACTGTVFGGFADQPWVLTDGYVPRLFEGIGCVCVWHSL